MFRLDASGPKILAQGIRNPWRYALDRATNDLYSGDVGQNLWEEVDVVPLNALSGKDFGWKVMEGTICTPNVSPTMSGVIVERRDQVLITGGR